MVLLLLRVGLEDLETRDLREKPDETVTGRLKT